MNPQEEEEEDSKEHKKNLRYYLRYCSEQAAEYERRVRSGFPESEKLHLKSVALRHEEDTLRRALADHENLAQLRRQLSSQTPSELDWLREQVLRLHEDTRRCVNCDFVGSVDEMVPALDEEGSFCGRLCVPCAEANPYEPKESKDD